MPVSAGIGRILGEISDRFHGLEELPAHLLVEVERRRRWCGLLVPRAVVADPWRVRELPRTV